MARARGERVALVILDGFGLSPREQGNAVFGAKLPTLERLIGTYQATTLGAAGNEVGLEWGEVGNSEVGHFNIGAGQVVLQDLPRINAAIASKRFETNAALQAAFGAARENGGRLHLIGLMSNGGVHGHIDHLKALLVSARRARVAEVVVHGITDGRDTPPRVAERFVKDLLGFMKRERVGRLATLVGRHFAMDRDRHWDRVEPAFRAFVEGQGTKWTIDPLSAVKDAYARHQSDETLEALVAPDAPGIATSDVVIMTNIRADRARQLMQSLTDPDFAHFKRPPLDDLSFVSFTNYGLEATRHVRVAFFAEPLPHFLGASIANAKRRQLHVAETEKYAHVTYFLNAGREEELPGEERVLIPSPNVRRYDTRPAMAAEKLTDEFLKRFRSAIDFGVINYANPDMVGHTGNYDATVKALEVVDHELKRLTDGLLTEGITVLITADHGNCEQMIHPRTGEIDKEHTPNVVPLVLVRPNGATAGSTTLRELAGLPGVGVLADIAPTVLDLMALPIPASMTGQSLVDVIGP